MNDNAKAWIAALRSGDYVQARGKLADFSGYCCLGVACDISGLGDWDFDDHNYTYIVGDSYSQGELVPEVAEWLGLKPNNTTVRLTTGPIPNLAIANDGRTNTDEQPGVFPHTFEQIADLIEAHASELFVDP